VIPEGSPTPQPPQADVQTLPPAAGDAGLLERFRSTGASTAILALGALMIALGGAGIALAGLREAVEAPPRQPPWRRRR
jgi:hypothetical protein